MLFRPTRVLHAGQAQCPPGRCGDVGGALLHMLLPSSAARGRPCAWHSCSLQPRQRTALHVTRVASNYRNRFPGLLWLRGGCLQCYHRTSAGPRPHYRTFFCQKAPCFLPDSSAFARITRSPALQHHPLTQAEPFLGSSTTRVSKTGKICPLSMRVLYCPAVGINHRLLHDLLAPTIYIISQ